MQFVFATRSGKVRSYVTADNLTEACKVVLKHYPDIKDGDRVLDLYSGELVARVGHGSPYPGWQVL